MEWSWLQVAFISAIALVSVVFFKPKKDRQKIVDVLWMIFLTPVFAFTIWLEKSFPNVFKPSFPRRTSEILANPQKLFSMIKIFAVKSGDMPAGSNLVSIQKAGMLEAEPDKNNMVCILSAAFKAPNGSDGALPLFIKFQSDRGTSTLIKALVSTFSGYHKEIEFYKRLGYFGHDLGIEVPQFYGGGFSRFYHRVVVVMKMIPAPWATVPDHKGASYEQALLLVTGIAKVHSKFWKEASVCDSTSFIKYSVGLGWLDLVKIYFNPKTDPMYRAPMWAVLEKHFEKDDRMCLSHGDCRPGNMMFSKDPGTGGERVIFADWEAVTITPFMWDFMYCTVIGQSTENRRANHDRLMIEYRNALLASGKVNGDEVTIDVCQRDFRLLTVVLLYYGFLLENVAAVGKAQGNTNDDVDKWTDRIIIACLEVTPKDLLDVNVPQNIVDNFFEELQTAHTNHQKKMSSN